MSQNRKCKSSGSENNCGSFPPRRINLFWHHPDARVALQQSPILQGNMDKLREMNYNGKRKSSVATAMEDRLKPLRPFTQLLEHTQKYSYDVFGKPEIRNANDEILSSSTVGNRYMFTGREYDSETGNYYYRARYYSPKLGRFLQTDPIGYEGGLNLYGYCGNNPLNWIDPFGLCKDEKKTFWEQVADLAEKAENKIKDLRRRGCPNLRKSN